MSLRDIYVFLGPPGAGKGSLSQKCIAELNWRQLSTGMLCRKHIQAQTEFGKQIDFAIKSGKLIDDALIIGMVEQWLADHQNAQVIILDGFPRTLGQAVALQEFIESKGQFRLNVIQLTISNAVIFDRIAGRLMCQDSECQAVFSGIPGSTQAPKKSSVCDLCGGELTRRSDDQRESIQERLKIYEKHAGSLTDFYHKAGQEIHEINVEKPLEEVFKQFVTLENVKKV